MAVSTHTARRVTDEIMIVAHLLWKIIQETEVMTTVQTIVRPRTEATVCLTQEMIVTTDRISLIVPTSVLLQTEVILLRKEVHRILTVQEIRKHPAIMITVETVVMNQPVLNQALSKIARAPASHLMIAAVRVTMETQVRIVRTTDHRFVPILLKEIPANQEAAEDHMKTPVAVKDQNAAVVLQDKFSIQIKSSSAKPEILLRSFFVYCSFNFNDFLFVTFLVK